MNSSEREAARKKAEADRPTCWRCGKEIAKATYWLQVPNEIEKDDIYRITTDLHNRPLPGPILQITRFDEPNPYLGYRNANVWCGQWQHGGLFHSQECGYWWARLTIENSKKEAK